MTSPSHLSAAEAAPGKPRASSHTKAVALHASATQPRVGSVVVLSGRVSVPRKATGKATRKGTRTVTLQRRTSAKTPWRTVAKARATRNGTYRFTRRVTSTQRVTYRVLGPGKKVSRTVALRGRAVKSVKRPTMHPVRRPTPTPKPSPAPTPVAPPAPADVLRAELRSLVDDYRADNGRRAADGNACLGRWADGFAARMATTTLFAHSGSWEWHVFGQTHLSARLACRGEAPGVVRQEAIAHVTGTDPVAAARAAFEQMTSWWAHDDVLLDDFGTDRVMSVGAAPADGDGWYVVVVFGAE